MGGSSPNGRLIRVFDSLSGKLDEIFTRLRGKGKLTEENIRDSLREIRRALLEVDVNFKVAKDFVQRVKERAVGAEVLKSLTPGQQIVRIVHHDIPIVTPESGATVPISPTAVPICSRNTETGSWKRWPSLTGPAEARSSAAPDCSLGTFDKASMLS